MTGLLLVTAGVLMIALGLSGASPSNVVPVEKEPLHRPIFSNDEVQVLDVVIPAQTATLFHTHSHDLVGVTIASSPSRNEIPGKDPTIEPADPEGEAWFEPFASASTHRVVNLGSRAIHYVVFQLLRPMAAKDVPTAGTAPAGGGKVVLENPRIRVVRIDLGKGEESAEHHHRSGFGMVALKSGRIAENGGSEEIVASPGFVGWRGPGSRHVPRNSGDSAIEVLELEIRQ